MNLQEVTLRSKIHYYGREKYYQAMQDVSIEGTRKFGGDAVYKFYSAIAHLLQGHSNEAIRHLQPLQSEQDVMLGVILALIAAHRHCQVLDKEALVQLDAKLKEERKKAGSKALYYAGLFLFFNGRFDKAREYVDRMLKLSSDDPEGLCLKGWIEVQSGRDSKVKDILPYFEAVLQSNSKHMDALFGKAKHFESREMYKEAMDTLNILVVAMPGFPPPLVEKIKVFLAEADWEKTADATERVLSVDPHNIDAQKYKLLYQLCSQGIADEVSHGLQTLYSEVDRTEPNNAVLFMHMAQLFSRTCGRNRLILEETFMMASRAVKIDTSCAEYLTEVGYQCLLQGRNKEALKYYSNAIKLDEASTAAITGIITCQLLEGETTAAEEHLSFLNELQQSLGTSPDILYLTAVLGRLKADPAGKLISKLSYFILDTVLRMKVFT